jgi:hypothetical protein
MKKSIGVLGALTLGLGLALAAPTAANAADHTILVPNDFVPAASDTRLTGHYEVQDTGLHIWTTDAASPGSRENKVAEYVAADVPLADVGEPSLDYTATSGIAPGFQLIVDFDGTGGPDGILVGETVYGNDWWASNGSAAFVKTGAPSHTGGSGSENHGTLEQWRTAFPDAKVVAFGFSLGSGVLGDGVINSIEFAGDTYTFAAAVTLTNKDQCKNGGWTTANAPSYRNQGECVSSFASQSSQKVNKTKAGFSV